MPLYLTLSIPPNLIPTLTLALLVLGPYVAAFPYGPYGYGGYAYNHQAYPITLNPTL